MADPHPEGEPEGILTGVFVDQTRRIGLVYQQPGDDQYFQSFPEPGRHEGGCLLVLKKNSEPEVIRRMRCLAIEQHIEKHLW